MNLIKFNIEKINALCRRYNVKNLYVFGSILSDNFNINSDVDLLIDFDKELIPIEKYADNFFDFMFEMQDLLGRKIDLVCDDAVSNPFFRQELDETKIKIYG